MIHDIECEGIMKIGMIFPGYGSQFVGMGKELYDESRIMQEYFEQASHCLDINFIKLCFASSDVELGKMQHAYTSLFLINSSIAAILKEAGIKPDVVAGYNVGQYAAMHAANGLTFADGLYLLSKLSLFSQDLFEQQNYALARVKGCSKEELSALIESDAQSVNIVSFEMPNQHIISGEADELQACVKKIKEFEKVKVENVALEYGLHAPIMASAIEQFEVYFEKVDFKDVEIPIIANSSAQSIQTGPALKQEIIDYATKPIAWLQTMQELHTCDVILSVGPGSALNNMITQLYPNKQILSIQKPADVQQAKDLILGSEPEPNPAEPKTEETIGL